MAIQFSAPRTTELKPRIVVFGVGGAGGNAVNNMIESGLEGVEFVVANTDAQQLAFAKTEQRIQLGISTTQGLGAGAHPEVGMTAAEESSADIGAHLDGVHMVFITAGMGGGTGTGAAPIIAKAARERGILTVGVVTKPFHFEGRHRMRLAEAGIAELQRYVDTLIVIPNQNLFRLANEKTTFAEAFALADQVLDSGVRSITDLMILPGLINLDFADVRTVMTEMGKAMMGTGEASGEGRALHAAQNAIANPLLDEVSLKGAKAVLVNVTGGPDMTLLEVDEACNAISAEVDPEANTIFGAAFDNSLQGKIRVSVVATGMDGASAIVMEPKTVRPPTTQARPADVRTLPAAAEAENPATTTESLRPAAKVEQDFRLEPSAPRYEAPVGEPALFAAQAAKLEDEVVSYTPAEPAKPEPLAAKTPASAPAPSMKIIDPMVEEDEPLFAPSLDRQAGHHQPQKSGRFFSLFGARRGYEAEAPQAPVPAAPKAAAAPLAQSEGRPSSPRNIEAQEEDDLEIPSFLRRLAN